VMVFGFKPVCLIIVKKAFSLIGTRRVILMIRFLSIIAFFKCYSLHRVSFSNDKVSYQIYIRLSKIKS
jgi:hypothetical protein